MTQFGAAHSARPDTTTAAPGPQLVSYAPTAATAPEPLTASPDALAAARQAAIAALSTARATGDQRALGMATTAPAADPPRRAPEPAAPGARRRRATGPLGYVGFRQIICWQLVLVAIVLVVVRPSVLTGALAALAVVVLALTVVRWHGRWLFEWLPPSANYLLRHRNRALGDAGETGRTLLRLLAPEAIGSTADGSGDRVFLLSGGTGISTVLQPQPTTGDPANALRSPETLLPPPGGSTAAAVQLVVHAGIDRDRPPRIWFALQALRTVAAYQDAELRPVLGNTVRRIQRQLRRDGCPARGLAEHELLGTLAALAHVNAGRGQIREEWQSWRCGPVTQVTFRLDGWADLTPTISTKLLPWLLAAVPYTAATVSVTARRTDDDPSPRVDAALRIAATNPAALAHAEHQLTDHLRRWGIRLTRLDGRHAWGLAATLPLGLPDPADCD